MKRKFLVVWIMVAAIWLCAWNLTARAATVTLAWNPSETAIGYKVYFRGEGTQQGEYEPPLDAGNVTEFTIPQDLSGPYWFAVTAYNAYGESQFSVEAFGNLILPVYIIKMTEDYGGGVIRETTFNP